MLRKVLSGYQLLSAGRGTYLDLEWNGIRKLVGCPGLHLEAVTLLCHH